MLKSLHWIFYGTISNSISSVRYFGLACLVKHTPFLSKIKVFTWVVWRVMGGNYSAVYNSQFISVKSLLSKASPEPVPERILFI